MRMLGIMTAVRTTVVEQMVTVCLVIVDCLLNEVSVYDVHVTDNEM